MSVNQISIKKHSFPFGCGFPVAENAYKIVEIKNNKIIETYEYLDFILGNIEMIKFDNGNIYVEYEHVIRGYGGIFVNVHEPRKFGTFNNKKFNTSSYFLLCILFNIKIIRVQNERKKF